MALIKTDSGNRVGWEHYDNEQEARDRAARARAEAADMERRGYDFGYSVPGEVQKVEGADEWIVTTP